MNIENKQKLLAEFLEWEYENTSEVYLTNFLINTSGSYNTTEGDWTSSLMLEEMKFNSDWNWIFKVLEKLTELNVVWELSPINFSISYNPLWKSDMSTWTDNVIDISEKGGINSVFEGLVKFVQKYNEYGLQGEK